VARAQVMRVVEREWIVWRRLWRASVFSAFVTPALFLAAMGLGLGGLVQKGSGNVEGVTYLQFVTPGLMAATAALMAAAESLWPVLGGAKWMRTYHAAVATPVSPTDVLDGHLVWVAFRTGLASTVFLIVAAILGGVVSPWGVVAIPCAVLGALALAAPLSAFAITQQSDLPFALVMRIGVFPLFLFSGTFFPVSQLPDWLQPLAVLSPLWHSVALCRMATTGDADVLAALGHVVALGIFIGLGWRWGSRTFTRRLAG
jgi:lipooligosaccharide transport system permease protein